FFGADDDVTHIEHTEELLAASRKAREQLPELYKVFHQGLKPGEYIEVKAPFRAVDEGNEWMWVEVTKWDGHNITGVLENDPEKVPGLHGGQVVEVNEDDVFDYIRHYSDGHSEGNTTREIIEKMEDEQPKKGTKGKLVGCTPP